MGGPEGWPLAPCPAWTLQPAGWYAAPVTIWTVSPSPSCAPVLSPALGHTHTQTGRKHGDLPFLSCFLPLHGDVDLRKQTATGPTSPDDFRAAVRSSSAILELATGLRPAQV